ncbi:hypothetical protein [Algiphilus sp.]|uniref:hypothetical protein n=1 Tax=Algiphilus sp. TaxID=1872431 RepID=UPI001CA6C37A|nr:hypothetical protein [Algiphilus sp.]MBY8965412.1 hypothetical protein [Algiphilus acroporae]MCI5062773.1 hypothetical protein [Algiphilus sp.]MCI5103300.1 hypothetical protein [Algiphilus sp.]MCR9090975.1 hypothetical protein [Pseudomonadota bacterium]
MKTIPSRLLAPLLALLLALSAGCAGMSEPAELPPPHSGNVQNVAEFREFLDSYQPTERQFRQVYPDITLVMPGDIATKELRLNNSRFFAELNDKGRIVDGRFQ